MTLDAQELGAELSALDHESAARTKQASLLDGDLIGLLELQAKGLVPNNRVTTLQRDAAGLAAGLARLAAQRDRIKARLERVEITAPVSGWVLNIVTHTVGGVIAPGATIAEIVPSRSGLVIEAKLSPSDIDQVREGQKAAIRLTSFNQR